MSQRRAFVALSCSLLIGAIVSGCGSESLSTPSVSSPAAPSASQGLAGSANSGPGSNRPAFLTADPTAPTMANPIIAFWAKKGFNSEVRMYYHARPGHTDSTTFMAFRIKEEGLKQRPDGTNLVDGDSVLITVTLVDPVSLKLDFQPSGLRFTSNVPAELQLSFKETLRDLNGDGVVDHKDADILRTLSIWCRELPTDPWFSVPSVVLSGSFDVQAKIGGFSGYAVAY